MLTFSDLSLDTGYLDFLPNLDIKPKSKAQITENWRLSLEETLSEAYHEGTLENDLPVNISAQIKATDALREKITKLVSTLAKKHRWNDPIHEPSRAATFDNFGYANCRYRRN